MSLRATCAVALLLGPSCGPQSGTSDVPEHRGTSSAADLINAVREIRRAVSPGAGPSDVSLFFAPIEPSATRAATGSEPCLEPVTQPHSLAQVIPAPGHTDVFASDREGALYRRNQELWEPVSLPPRTPPIIALLGFVEARSPLELVVGVQSKDESELWTLVVAGTQVTNAQPTPPAAPYQDPLEFLRAHQTPTCRSDDTDCLTWIEIDGQWVVDVAPRRFGENRRPLIEIDQATVFDVAWADEDGSSVFIVASGAPCIAPSSVSSNVERRSERPTVARRGQFME